MLEKYPQPRWGLVYLSFPLACVLLWLIQRAQPSGPMRSMLDIGALLIVFGLVEVWRLANMVALLHHPLISSEREPIYYAQEVAAPVPAELRRGIQAVFVADSYSALFTFPVQVGEPLSPSMELPSLERRG